MELMDFEALKEKFDKLIEEKKLKDLQNELENTHAFDIAEYLSDLADEKPPSAVKLFRLLSKEKGADVFAELDAVEQEIIITALTDIELSNIVEDLYVDDAVDMMEELPANLVKRVMRIATPETRKLINQFLKYPVDSTGSIMTAEFVDLKKYLNVREAVARIRRIGEDTETIYVCYVTSADRKLEGVVSFKKLLLSDEDEIIEDIMDTNVLSVYTTDDREETAKIISDYDLLALPVVDTERRLVGIVTVDDVIDVIQEEAAKDLEMMAGMLPSDKPYSRTSVWEIWQKRSPWLIFLMLSATFTRVVIKKYEGALSSYAILTGFIPMIMATGGNSGSQSSTSIISALSARDIELKDAGWIVWKEFKIAVLCGLALASVNFFKLLLIDKMLLGESLISIPVILTICISMFMVVIFAKSVGSLLPLFAKSLKLDPAVMASPIITTLTDTFSLLIYFYFATLILKIGG